MHPAGWLVLLALVTSGCVDQQQEVATYRKVLEGSGPLAVREDYSHGQPLSLEAALLLANRNEERLAIQGENYLQALIAEDRAFSAFLPTLALSPTYSWQSKKSVGGGNVFTGSTGTGTGGAGTGVVTPVGRSRYTTFDAPIALRANLFNGFRDISALQSARFTIEQNRSLLLDLQATVLLDTATTYYDVLLAERTVEVLSNSVEFQQARVADMLGRLRAGIAQPLDVAQTQAQEAATRAQLETARANVVNARLELVFLTKAQVRDATLIDRLEVPPNIVEPDRAVSIAQEHRLDIRAAAAAVEAARQNVQAAVGEYYPSISLNLNYYLKRQSFPTNAEWTGVLSANLPIFSAGVIRADVRDAWSRLRVALLQEWQLIRQVEHDVRADWQNLEASRLRIADLQTEVAASQEALRQSTQRYRVAGLATNLDVLTAQNTLLSSQLDLATEEFNYKIYYLDLLRATGQLPLPTTLNSMVSGAASRPTTEQTSPVLPGYQIGPMSLPTSRAAATHPGTVPLNEPTFPPASETQPTAAQPTTEPFVEPDLNLQAIPTTLPSLPRQ